MLLLAEQSSHSSATELLWLRRDGTPYNPSSMLTLFRELGSSLDDPISALGPHVCRDMFITGFVHLYPGERSCHVVYR